MDANDGTGPHTWTYNYNNWNGVTTVTDPLGNQTIHTFDVGPPYGGPTQCAPYETQTQYEDNKGNVLKTVNTQYSFITDQNALWYGLLDVLPTSVTTVWPNGLQQTKSITYDVNHGSTFQFGMLVNQSGNIEWANQQSGYTENPWTTTETDYTRAVLNTTNTTYIAFSNSNYLNNNLLDLVSSIQVQDGGGVQRAYTTYTYDQYALQPSGVTEQHVAAENYPGNPTSMYRWLNGSNASTANCPIAISVGYLGSYISYYDSGMVYQSTDDCGKGLGAASHTTTYSYASTYYGAFPTTVTNPLNQTTTYAYDFNTGSATSITDANLQPTEMTYDVMGRKTSVTYPDGGSISYCYTDIGGATCSTASGPPYAAVKTRAISSSLSKTVTTVFDGLSRVSQTQLNSDPSGADYTLTTYDALGRKSVEYNATRCSTITSNCATETTWGFTTTSYDGLNRITSLAKQDGSTVSTTYGTTPPAGLTGYCSTVTDEAGNARQSCLDGLGRITSVVEDPGGGPHFSYLTTYGYDALNDLTGIVQNGSSGSNARTRAFVYDSLSRLTSATNPESGAVTYAYDADDNVVTKTVPSPNQPPTGTKSVTTTYTYDPLKRLTAKSYNDGYASNPVTHAVSYGYDGVAPSGCTPPTITSPTESSIPTTPTNTIGRRSSMCDGSGATAWIYDAMGRPTIETRTLNNITKTMGYVYYLGGEPSFIWYPSGNRMSFDVNAAGQTNGVTDETDNYVADNVYFTPSGAVSGLSQYSRSGSYTAGLAVNVYYNQRLQPALEYASNGTFFYQRCYDFHLKGGMNISAGGATCSSSVTSPGDNGNVYQIANNLDATRTQNFAYDSLNRINQVYTNGSNWGQQFATDAWGNVTAVTAISGKTLIGGFTASANTSNQLVGSSYAYDPAGNMTTDGNGGIYYDDESRIITTNSMTYTYDGNGVRVEKCTEGTGVGTCATIPTGTLYWTGVGTDALSESDLSGNIDEEYVFFNGMRVSKIDRPSDTVHALLTDHLGSGRLSVVATGTNTLTVEEDLDYTPYGIVATGSPTDHYQFTGKERDSESGMDNFGARYNASVIDRFMSADPLGGNVANPQSFNKYAYVLNNPLRYTDPTGLYACADDSNGSHCSSKQDQTFEKTLASLRGQGGDVGRAAAAYGAVNENNGVTVGFKDLSTKGENGITASTVGVDPSDPSGMKLRAESEVTINSKVSGDDYAAAVGHEGSHVADAQDVVKSGVSGGLVEGQPIHAGINITPYQSEQRAYGVTDAILSRQNQSRKFDCGASPCTLGRDSGIPALLPGLIDQIVAHNPVYNQGGHPMSSTNQGPSVVNGVTPNTTVPH